MAATHTATARPTCPACGSARLKATDRVQLSICRKCAAIFGGPIYLGDSYAIAGPGLHAETGAPIRYFDLDCLGSAGLQRRHGWVEVGSNRVVQVG